MPDWSYRTLFQPLLLRMPVAGARAIALRGIGALAKLPGGKSVIDFMGHMRPDTALSFEKCGLTFPARVGLGCLIDPTANALDALSRFGFGCIEVGPVVTDLSPSQSVMARFDRAGRRVVVGPDTSSVHWEALHDHLKGRKSTGTPIFVRLPVSQLSSPCVGCESLWLEKLVPLVDGVVLDSEGSDEDDDALRKMLDALACDLTGVCRIWREVNPAGLPDLVREMLRIGRLQGLLLEVDSCSELVRDVRQQIGPESLLIVRGRVIDPQEALDLFDVGADIVLIDDGLVFSGPGLAKRINEACLYRIPIPVLVSPDMRLGPASWLWTLLLGTALFGGGLLALMIAMTRVILPYDESFVGMNREQLCGVNSRLVDFMSHDRVTLAGTMMSLGLCYVMLSYFGVRRGRHWAKVTIQASCFVGFLSFFAFLGYGYFDPFHAFVAAVLFQFQLFGLAAPLSPVHDRVTPTLREDRAWRLSQWGQLLLICHAIALFVAGVVIVGIGSTSVFVSEDLEFMDTTVSALSSANPRIVPLIAHDRASFGGMLLSCGLVTLLPALWGFERGRAWLWWLLAGAGILGYLCAIAVHLAVGYTDCWHLAPAIGGAFILALGLGYSRAFLCDVPSVGTQTKAA